MIWDRDVTVAFDDRRLCGRTRGVRASWTYCNRSTVLTVVTSYAATALLIFGLSMPLEEARAKGNDGDVIETIREFYNWYWPTINDQAGGKRTRRAPRKFTTDCFEERVKALSKSFPDGYSYLLDEDAYILTQDWPGNFPLTVSVEHILNNGAAARADITLKAKHFRRKLRLLLLYQNGMWLIDQIDG